MRRVPWRTGATVGVSVALLLGAWPAAEAAPPAPTTTSTALDLDDPEAGITDPLGSTAPLARDCLPGQVDVNTASAAAVAEAFSLETSPTVDRIIAGRPWLTPSDLLSVPGVALSAGVATKLIQRGCATPTQLPEPAPMACTRTSQVDLQTASASRIAKDLGLTRTTADAIVAHRPVPQNLLQIIAPRTPGLSADKARSLMTGGKACVTPMAFDFTGSGWRWVAPTRGAVIEAPGNEDFALIVPPNAVGGTGTWGKVTPDTAEFLPTADLHLFAPFTGLVAARLPDISEGHPMVLHETGTAGIPSLSFGDGVEQEPGGTVVASLRSLSTVQSLALEALCPVLDENSHTYCAGSAFDDSILDLVLRDAQAVGGRLNQEPPAGPCDGGIRAISTGELSRGMRCTVTEAGSTATWNFENETGFDLVAVQNFGAVFEQVHVSGPYRTPSVELGDHGGLLSRDMTRVFGEHGAIVPGVTLGNDKPAGEDPTTFDIQALNPLLHLGFFVLYSVAEIADQVVGGMNLGDCTTDVINLITNDDLAEAATLGGLALGCLQDLIGQAIDLRLGLLGSTAADNIARGKLETAKAALRKIAWVQLGFSYASGLISTITSSYADHRITIRYLAPAPPAGGTGPGSAGELGLGPEGQFIARLTTPADQPRTLLVEADGTARHITTGEDFNCYATRLLVADQVTSYDGDDGHEYLNLTPRVRIVDQPAPTCVIPPYQVWVFEPAPGNVPRNVILRGAWDGSKYPSWFINAEGEIDSILNGSQYLCLARIHPVVWDVPYSAIQAWTPVGDGLDLGSCTIG